METVLDEPWEHLLAQVAEALASAPAERPALQEAARLCCPHLADWCVLHRVGPGESLELVARGTADPRYEALQDRLAARWPNGSPAGLAAVRDVIRRRDSVLIPSVQPAQRTQPAAPGDEELLREAAVESVVVVPLMVESRIVGAMTFLRAAGSRRYTECDLVRARRVGRLVAMAIERARLDEERQAAREAAEGAARRLSRLQEVTAALSGSVSTRDVAHAIATHGAAALGALAGAISLVEESGRTLRSIAALGYPQRVMPVVDAIPVDAQAAFALAFRTGRTVWSPDRETLLARSPDLRSLVDALDSQSHVAVPLGPEGAPFGVMGFSFARPHALDEEGHAFVRALAQQCTQALERARSYDAERRARAEWEQVADRTRRLHRVTFELSHALSPARAVEVVLQEGVSALGARAGSVAVLSLEGDAVTLLGSVGYAEELVRRFGRLPLAALHPLTDVARTMEPVFAESFAERVARYPHLLDVANVNGEGAMASLPLVVDGRCLGAMGLNFAHARRFDAPDREFLLSLARQCAQALERGRLFEAERAERRAAEEARARTVAILESIQDAFFALDREGRFAYVNAQAEALLGWRKGALLGRPLWTTDAPGLGARIRKECEAAALEGRAAHFEEEASALGKWFEVHVYPGADGLSVYLRDVTARKEGERQLEAARHQLLQREKLAALGTLVSGVAHEVRTPLTYIQTNLFSLEARLLRGTLAGCSSPEHVKLLEGLRPHVGAAVEGIDRVNELVRQLRRFTREETAAEPVVEGLERVVDDATRLFRATHRGGVAVEARLAATRPVALDRVQVQQVVLNLLQNAADASLGAGAPVVIETRDADGWAELVVRDEGTGIPPDVVARMYEPLFTTKPEGTGLGLSIVRRIVETHRGSIACESRPGAGTTFTVRFPALPPLAPP